ncbi:MAG: LamG domain-containing protein [Armatimonadia bacterium]
MAYGYYKTLTIDHTKCGSANSSDFPLLVYLTDVDLKTTSNGGYVQHAQGYDLAFFSDAGLTTQLKHEVVSYNASTGAVELWVKVPTLSYSADTLVYMAFGDAGISTPQADGVNVWSSAYKAVYHLAEARSTGAGAYKDATSNANNGTLTDEDSDCIQADVKIGKGVDFGGDATDRIAVADSASLDFTSDFAITGWVRVNSTPAAGNFYGVLGKGTSAIPSNFLIVADNGYLSAGLGLAAAVYNSGGSVVATKVTISANTLYFFCVKWVAATGSISISIDNGTPAASSGSGYTANANTAKLTLGHWSDADAAYAFDGLLDEVRLYSGALSADEITAQYNNQNTPATFYSVGARTSTSSATTGSGALTVSAPAPAGTGSMQIAGSGAPVVAASAVAGAGSLGATGSGAAVVAAPVVAGTGSHINGASGSGALTIPAPVAAGTGSIKATGSGAPVVAAPVAAGVGTLKATGSGAAVVAASVAAGVGTLMATGSGALTVATAVVAGTGAHNTGIAGSGALTVSAPVAAGAGTLKATGSGALAVAAPTTAGAGTLKVTGSGALVVSAPATAGIGTASEGPLGSGDLDIAGPVVSGSGFLLITGTGGIFVGLPTISNTYAALWQEAPASAIESWATPDSPAGAWVEQPPAGGDWVN